MKEVKSVLVVEDFPLMTDSVVRVLHAIDPNYEIQCVSRLAEAEAMLYQQHVDMLVTDIQLHEDKQAGLRLVTLARQQHADIRTVIYTQFDDPDIVQAGILAGVRRQIKVDKWGEMGKRQFSKLFHLNHLSNVQFSQEISSQPF